MSFTFKPSTLPAGVQANDATGKPESRLPIQQFKDGGTIHGGEFTRSVHVTVNSGDPVKLPAGPGKLTFRSEHGGSIISGRQARMTDIVEHPAFGDTSLGAALAAGLVVESANGSFEYANAVGGPAVETARTTESETAASADDRAGEPQAPARDVLPEAQEAFFAEVTSYDTDGRVGNAVIDAIASGAQIGIDSPVIQQFAQQADTTPENALQTVAHIEGQFVKQAQQVMQEMVGDPSELYAWLNGTDEGRDAMRQAARQQLHDRSLDGWRDAAHSWIMQTARNNPERLLSANFGPGVSTKLGRDGQLMLHHPSFGWTTFAAAVRGGLISIGRP
jgi:hypothetical protein